MKRKRRSHRKKWILVSYHNNKRTFFYGLDSIPNTVPIFSEYTHPVSFLYNLHIGCNIEDAYTFSHKTNAKKFITYINYLYEKREILGFWLIDVKPDFQIVSL